MNYLQPSLLLFSALVSSLFLANCGREKEESLTLYKILPPQAPFAVFRSKARSIPWKNFVDTRRLPLIPERSGVQLGLTLAQWSLAEILGDEKNADLISANLVRLSKEMDIDDEALLVRLKNRVEAKGAQKTEEAVRKDIRAVEKELGSYFEKKGKGEWSHQLLFGSWLELLSVTLKGLTVANDPSLAGFLARRSEASYFLVRFAEGKGNYEKETAFLKEAMNYFDTQEKSGLGADDIRKLAALVHSLRTSYEKKW
ncbi:MAG: hypothetical protein JNM63_11815 [Spirochaetia bacterium]|nr:hypothetical protein [Spirochaetia bacterium]